MGRNHNLFSEVRALSDGLSPEKIADTLAAIDEFVRSSSALEWTMPSDLLGSRVNGGAGKRCAGLI